MLADVPIHVAIDDMQVSEDLQMAIGHMIMQWLATQRDSLWSLE
jgi:D-sedoheptulose 7-phosphate isomerase